MAPLFSRKSVILLFLGVFVFSLLFVVGLLVFLRQQSFPPAVREAQIVPEELGAEKVRRQAVIIQIAREERYLVVQPAESQDPLKVLLEKNPSIIQWYFLFEKGDAPDGTVIANEKMAGENDLKVGQKILLYSVPHEKAVTTVYASQIYIFP